MGGRADLAFLIEQTHQNLGSSSIRAKALSRTSISSAVREFFRSLRGLTAES